MVLAQRIRSLEGFRHYLSIRAAGERLDRLGDNYFDLVGGAGSGHGWHGRCARRRCWSGKRLYERA